MQFTFRLDTYLYNGIKELARRHKVKVGTVLVSLIRRGLIVGLVYPFNPLPSHQDDKALLKELGELGKEGEALFCEYFGVDINSLTFEQLADLADGKKMSRAIVAKHFPDYPDFDKWDNFTDLYRDIARWEREQLELEQSRDMEALERALEEMEES